MPVFIQTMYGAVLGVNFYQIITEKTERLVPSLGAFLNFYRSESVFQFLLFSFTLLIVAHDWFSYNEEGGADEKNTVGNYWGYVPQIFSLFFISQMFVATKFVNFQCWYLFAFWYTICNIMNGALQYMAKREINKLPALVSSLKRTMKDNGKRYIFHGAITISGYVITTLYQNIILFDLLLIVTAAIVIWLWSKKAKASRNS